VVGGLVQSFPRLDYLALLVAEGCQAVRREFRGLAGPTDFPVSPVVATFCPSTTASEETNSNWLAVPLLAGGFPADLGSSRVTVVFYLPEGRLEHELSSVASPTLARGRLRLILGGPRWRRSKLRQRRLSTRGHRWGFSPAGVSQVGHRW
jgi:hypothetical protein